MAEHPHESLYMRIFWYLLAYTIIEVLIALPDYSPLLKGTLLVALALLKAVLVALNFMHLRFERRTMNIIAITPLIICVFLVFMLLPDLGGTPHKSTGPTTSVTGTKR